MKIEDYENQLKTPLKPRTVCFLVRGNQVLLGFKKRGFGKGNFKGLGGKVEKGETLKQGAIRELNEEIGINALSLRQTGEVDFLFPYVENPQEWNQKVYVYLVDKWQGEPKESDEIFPRWFIKDNLPFATMWADNPLWIPKILEGAYIKGKFLFNKKLEVEDYQIINKEIL